MQEEQSSGWKWLWEEWPYSQDFVHGMFTRLEDKARMVKQWPGIKPDDVDTAIAYAASTGIIAMYDMETKRNPFLDLVITVYLGSIQETFTYAVARTS